MFKIILILIALSVSGCTVVGTAVCPITGAIDGGRLGADEHPALIAPGIIGGLIMGPFAGFVSGMRNDCDLIADHRYPSDAKDKILYPYSYHWRGH